jgi:ornithine cyclodeaminase
MRIISADDLARIFTFPLLAEALKKAFTGSAVTPTRHHHSLDMPGGSAATLLLMPAWDDLSGSEEDAHLGVKIVTVHPDNPSRGRPSISGTYLLMAARTGEPLAVIDGQALTLWRTAAASALAASYLAREDSSRLLMAGAGALAPYLIAAHASIRPIADVAIWNRTADKAEALASRLAEKGFPARAVTDLEAAARTADIISCATLSRTPLVRGAWLAPGAHIDLVGAFTPEMRESDDEALRRALVFVDTRDGALAEAGDILQPIRSGAFDASGICGDLFDLCRGDADGRLAADDITLFKSVGTALEDLAAAVLAFSRAG